jgi:hypothetical protein
MILLSVLSPICWVLASLCNAVMDTLADRAHFEQSIFSKYDSNFWLKTDSWKNKYNDIDGDGYGDVEGGFRYNSIFAFLNNLLDGWHLFQSTMVILLALSVVLFQYTVYLFIFDSQILNIFMWVMIFGVLWNVPFSLAYHKYLKK